MKKVIVGSKRKNKLFLSKFVEKEKIEKAKGERKEVGRTIPLNEPNKTRRQLPFKIDDNQTRLQISNVAQLARTSTDGDHDPEQDVPDTKGGETPTDEKRRISSSS
ncbi:hypothetical protein NC651_030671 [Populus alba x Populus x berolinensis]|nr:hypothetical protein NC651_030671 [Populus alba x Populus x berolinensis]